MDPKRDGIVGNASFSFSPSRGVPYPQAQRMLLLENGDVLYLQKRVTGIFPPGQFFTWGVGLGGKGVL